MLYTTHVCSTSTNARMLTVRPGVGKWDTVLYQMLKCHNHAPFYIAPIKTTDLLAHNYEVYLISKYASNRYDFGILLHVTNNLDCQYSLMHEKAILCFLNVKSKIILDTNVYIYYLKSNILISLLYLNLMT